MLPPSEELLVLTAQDVLTLFDHDPGRIIDAISESYRVYGPATSSLPHSVFLRFPGNDRNRIIALPAYLGGSINAAGVKWISSFPENLALGIERASAALILNSTETGRPLAMLESSIISAWRTAAGGAIAAQCLYTSGVPAQIGLIGTGLINFTTLRFLKVVFPGIQTVFLYDTSRERAEQFQRVVDELNSGLSIELASSPEEAMRHSDVLSLATNAGVPHIHDISACREHAVILHLSLRDLSPEIIRAADNVVDDPDHVCRASTSLHLAEQQAGNRDFIRATLGELLNGTAAPKADGRRSIFSPFGLGILDVALAKLIYDKAVTEKAGHRIAGFFPRPWFERSHTTGV